MKPLFVTGTDTGVGKTRVATALLTAFAQRGLRVAGMKPVAAGLRLTPQGSQNDDAFALRAASTARVRAEDVNPYAFGPAIAPHIAAGEEGRTIEMAVLEHAFERLALVADAVVIEGAGGWLTPLSDETTLADFAAIIGADVILVVGLRLGCLNHALLTAHAVRSRGLHLAGWVGNAIDPAFERPQANISTLHARLAAPCLGLLTYRPRTTPTQTAALLTVDSVLKAGLSGA